MYGRGHMKICGCKSPIFGLNQHKKSLKWTYGIKLVPYTLALVNIQGVLQEFSCICPNGSFLNEKGGQIGDFKMLFLYMPTLQRAALLRIRE